MTPMNPSYGTGESGRFTCLSRSVRVSTSRANLLFDTMHTRHENVFPGALKPECTKPADTQHGVQYEFAHRHNPREEEPYGDLNADQEELQAAKFLVPRKDEETVAVDHDVEEGDRKLEHIQTSTITLLI